MEAHLRVLLELAANRRDSDDPDDAPYVWWGKVRSPNRQQQQAHQDDIRKVAEGIDGNETHLYLTDYRSLYVGDLEEIVEGPLPAGEEDRVPRYYADDSLDCDFWFRLADIRRLVTDDLLGVIEELKLLRNVHYNDRPVSLYGGMVDLPLVVTRPDGKRFFDSDESGEITGGKLWAQWDSERGVGLGAIERELRENLFGASAWSALESTTRTFIATGEQVFRAHRSDPAFDFAQVLGSFAKAMEVQCNTVLRRALKTAPLQARHAKLQDFTRDVTEGRPLSLGELAKAIGGERVMNEYLSRTVQSPDRWFTSSLPAVLDGFAEVRNPGTHAERVDRETAIRWRDRLMGVGCQGVFVQLARVKPA